MTLLTQFGVCIYDKHNLKQLSQDCGTRKYWEIDSILSQKLSSYLHYSGRGNKMSQIKITNNGKYENRIIFSNGRYVPLLLQLCIPLFKTHTYGGTLKYIEDKLNYLGFNVFSYNQQFWDAEINAFKQFMIEITDPKTINGYGFCKGYFGFRLGARTRQKVQSLLVMCELNVCLQQNMQ